MKKSILIPAAIATIGITGASVFAATTSTMTTTSSTPSTTSSAPHSGMRGMGGHGGGHMMQMLTDAEKTALQSMSETDRKAFFEKKRVEMQAKMSARDAVIDKLLAGQALTSEEETLRKTIIQERATMKAERATMQAQMDKIKSIRDKQAAGQTLTAEEQSLLDSMPQRGKGKGHGVDHKASTTTSGTTAQ